VWIVNGAQVARFLKTIASFIEKILISYFNGRLVDFKKYTLKVNGNKIRMIMVN